MAYCTEAQIAARLAPADLAAALDDDNDGEADEGLLATIIADASAEVDGYLGQRFAVPFADNDVPDIVALATRLIVWEILFSRRGVGDDRNPHRSAANRMRERLLRIGTGKEPLRPATEQTDDAVGAVTGPAGTYLTGGDLAT